MKKTLCIYHGNCADGFGSAWVVRKALGTAHVEFYPGVYQTEPPDVTGRDVIMVDFSYKRAVLKRMEAVANSILILDHHGTAQIDLADLPLPTYQGHVKMTALFDMSRSGAGITWDYYFPGEPRPQLINHIEDRDLWKFKLPGTREIQANLFSFPYEFDAWDEMMAMSPVDLKLFQLQGESIERKHFKDIDELLRVATRPMKFKVPKQVDGASHAYEIAVVPAANLPYTLTSDAGHMLCERSLEGRPSADPADPYKQPFAVCYMDKPAGRYFSFRSRDDGADVGAIAKIYGGGGHAHAAGVTVPFSELAQFEP